MTWYLPVCCMWTIYWLINDEINFDWYFVVGFLTFQSDLMGFSLSGTSNDLLLLSRERKQVHLNTIMLEGNSLVFSWNDISLRLFLGYVLPSYRTMHAHTHLYYLYYFAIVNSFSLAALASHEIYREFWVWWAALQERQSCCNLIEYFAYVAIAKLCIFARMKVHKTRSWALFMCALNTFQLFIFHCISGSFSVMSIYMCVCVHKT